MGSKPTDVKVRDDGTVKVLDFGLVKAGGSGAMSGVSHNSATPAAAATRLGIIAGEPE